MREKLKKIEEKLEKKIDNKLLLFRIFDEPRPKYIANVTIIDRIFDKLFLWAFPQSVRPNHVTLFRFISIPFLVFFLLNEFYKTVFIGFAISAFSDAIDGAIARTRNKITDWGILFDPFADKLLVGSVGGIMIYKFLSPMIALVIISLEIILFITSYYRYKGEIVPAKTMGKLKMIFQCIGVLFIFLSLTTGISFFLTIAAYVLYLAIIFALLSLTIYRSI